MTDLEQLAKLLRDHSHEYDNANDSSCMCGHTAETGPAYNYGPKEHAHHIAQAITKAGWTAPIPEFQRKINQAIVNRAAAELGIIPHRFVIGVDQQTTPSYLEN